MLHKAVSDDELKHIESLLSSEEKRYLKDFLLYLATIKSVEVLKTVRKYIESGNYEAIVTYFDDLAKPLNETVRDSITNIGRQETKILQPKAQTAIDAKIPKGFPKPKIILSFDPGHQRASELIKNSSETLIRQITEDQRRIIYDIVADGLSKGSNSRIIASEIAENIGLTAYQRRVVENYRRLLEQGSKQALDRALRDRRFDRTIQSGKPLSQAQIDKMVEAYRKKYIRYRAETIARTEAGKAVSEAQEEALRQTMEDVGFTADDVVRTWHATRDSRTRDTHNYLNGKKVKYNQPFKSSSGAFLRYPRDPNGPASEVVNCRCTVTNSFT